MTKNDEDYPDEYDTQNGRHDPIIYIDGKPLDSQGLFPGCFAETTPPGSGLLPSL